jgi:2-amino-4-hydroxy-6-hydroxymethyldihydropteridine diphosphokinase
MTSTKRRVVFGLGSNLGERVPLVLSGARALATWAGACGVRLSPLYETVPVGGPPQDDFINAAISFQTALPARTLLTLALSIEQEHGRIRIERDGPRTLDIDLLWISGEVIDEPGLHVPHPRLMERAFALRPLLDVEPRALDPRTGGLMAESLSVLSMSGLRLHARECVPLPPYDAEGAAVWVRQEPLG